MYLRRLSWANWQQANIHFWKRLEAIDYRKRREGKSEICKYFQNICIYVTRLNSWREESNFPEPQENHKTHGMPLPWLACCIRKLRRKKWMHTSSILAKISRLTQACLRGPCPCKTAPNSAPDILLSHGKTSKSWQPSVIELFSQLCTFLWSVFLLIPWQEWPRIDFMSISRDSSPESY